MLPQLFKSVLEQDNTSMVLCTTDHIIRYMNPTAIKKYHADFTGKSIFDCHHGDSVEKIKKVTDWFAKSSANNRVHTFFNEKQQKDGYMIALRDEKGTLIGYYEKHEFRTRDFSPFYEMP